MELELIRTYFPSGTNGKILYRGRLLMYSIELPWSLIFRPLSDLPVILDFDFTIPGLIFVLK